MKFSKNERILIITAIVMLIFGIYYHFIYSPKEKSLTVLKLQIQSTKSELDQEELKLKTLGFLKNSQIRFLPRDEQLEKILVHAAKYPDIIISSITPTTQEKSLKVDIVCSGGMKSFMKYLASFSSLNLPMQIESISMGTNEGFMSFHVVLISYFL